MTNEKTTVLCALLLFLQLRQRDY